MQPSVEGFIGSSAIPSVDPPEDRLMLISKAFSWTQKKKGIKKEKKKSKRSPIVSGDLLLGNSTPALQIGDIDSRCSIFHNCQICGYLFFFLFLFFFGLDLKVCFTDKTNARSARHSLMS